MLLLLVMKQLSKKIRMQFPDEARILTRYLAGREPDEKSVFLYTDAVDKTALPFNNRQRRKWQKCIANPWLLPYVDSALAWNDPFHPIRNRIFIMVSILETRPAFQDLFLPVARNSWFFFRMTGQLGSGFLKLIAGKIALWII